MKDLSLQKLIDHIEFNSINMKISKYRLLFFKRKKYYCKIYKPKIPKINMKIPKFQKFK